MAKAAVLSARVTDDFLSLVDAAAKESGQKRQDFIVAVLRRVVEPVKLTAHVMTEDERANSTALMHEVKRIMADGQPHTLAELATLLHLPTGRIQSLGARVRDLRKRTHGRHTVERVKRPNGVYEYRMVK